MGSCASTPQEGSSTGAPKVSPQKAKTDPPAAIPTTAAALPSSQYSASQPAPKPSAPPDNNASLAEHIAFLQPLFCERTAKDARTGKDASFLVTVVTKPDGLEVGCSTNNGADVYHADAPVQQLEHQLKQLNPPVNGATFAKALKTAFANSTVTVEAANVVVVKVPIGDAVFSLAQLRQPRGNDKALRNRLFAAPLFHYWYTRKGDGSKQLQKPETEAVTMERNAAKLRSAGTEVARCRELRKRIERMRGGGNSNGKVYDPSGSGPSLYTLHHEQAQQHIPTIFDHNDAAMALIRKQYANANECEGVKYSPVGDDAGIIAKASGKAHESIAGMLDRIDDWNFDMFELAKASGTTALFHTTYALLHKHGLMGYFNLDHNTVVQFLSALEAGYHPNHYHNATHAADVLQCVHYMLGPGGMIRELALTPEEVLASILAAAMHDYDHPGLNNAYHIKTGAYLSTLYNDRSVLENHHCASTFELLRHDKYNIFKKLPEDQRKAIRDTMVEMVLSTDMGLHTKIFTQFKQRLRDLEPDGAVQQNGRDAVWKKPDDRRLALSIVLKMADISNCARPPDLYQGWAERLSHEFYMQGDLEREGGMTVSPFMDKTKHETEFPKGQFSFMRFIAMPLFEVGAEFLPKLDFTLPLMQANQDKWAPDVGGGSNNA